MLRVAPVSKNREVGEKKVFCKESSDEWRLSRRPDCLRRFTARRRRAAQRNKTYSLRSSAPLRVLFCRRGTWRELDLLDGPPRPLSFEFEFRMLPAKLTEFNRFNPKLPPAVRVRGYLQRGSGHQRLFFRGRSFFLLSF